MANGLPNKTVSEPAREINVFREADVVVVGGGPGGHSAAVAAARNGARTILIERYGHLGGMATGGLVPWLWRLSGGTREQQIAGLCQEWIDRLDTRKAVIHPKKEDLGSNDPEIVKYWRNMGVSFVSIEGRVRMGAIIDPEETKCILNDMAEEAGVKLLLHSWGTRAIVDNDTVKGVIFESKSGRQAILGKVVIDATGDGDLLPSAGADFTTKADVHLRIRQLAVVFQIANVDVKKFKNFRETEPDNYTQMVHQLFLLNGYSVGMANARLHEDMLAVNTLVPGVTGDLPSLNVEDITTAEVYVRKRMRTTLDFYRKNVPGFEKSYVQLTAPQLGTRGGRRVIGEYTVTEQDIHTGRIFEDTVAITPPMSPEDYDISPEHPIRCLPYRCLVPHKVEGLLVAGRSFSSEDRVNEVLSTIPYCIALGQAAGTAAALSVKNNIKLRKVDYQALQRSLASQGVPLPGSNKTNKEGNSFQIKADDNVTTPVLISKIQKARRL